MNHMIKIAPLFLFASGFAGCSAGVSSNLPPHSIQAFSFVERVPQWQASGIATAFCPRVPLGYARCDLLRINNRSDGSSIQGWTPANLQAAYHLPSSKRGLGEIVAIVDAFDNPNAASDLAFYRSQFGLGNANFTKYNQEGQQGNYPKASRNWGGEIDLDLQMVSASCPNCTIYLIEANGVGQDLAAADLEAVKLGAHIVTNSWGCEGSVSCVDSTDFSQPGVTYLASAGDNGYNVQAPAAFSSVIAVGGTTLTQSGSGYTQAVWVDSGAGCATGITKPSWQHDPDCTARTMNDVSAVASGVAFYDTYKEPGWIDASGTSISSPLTAGIVALAGNATHLHGGERFWKLNAKRKARGITPITSGFVEGCPASLAGTYLCEAGTNQYGQYSAPAGWGTPHGITAY